MKGNRIPMPLWPVLIVLTGLVVIIVAWPLFRARALGDASDHAGVGQLNVYKDQLAEIDRDLERGVIGDTEAEEARIELSRRMLSAAVPANANRSLAGRKTAMLAGHGVVKAAVITSIPLIAIGLYASFGVPSLPGSPREAKVAQQDSTPAQGAPDVATLIAQVEARLRSSPDDGRGWDVIAPVYLREQRFGEAKIAFARAIELLGEDTKRLLGLAESSIRARGGLVTGEARAAFEKVLKVEPNRVEPRFWLAIGREQRGELKEAAAEYRAILAEAPVDAPWRATVAERLAAVVPGETPSKAVTVEPGPTAAEAAAAASMTLEQRQQMISGMVGNLHARLKTNGRDPSGWLRLLRAYAVLGDLPKAKAVLAEARSALAGDQAGLSSVNALASEIGLGS